MKNNNVLGQMSKVLSLVTNVCPQPWAPLIDGLVDDAMLQLSPDGDKALHWKPFCSVLLAYGNNIYRFMV